MLKKSVFSLHQLYIDYDPDQVLCSCFIYSALLQKITSANKLKILLTDLYIQTTIDETIYWLLQDSKNVNCLNDNIIYKKYRKQFPFPKFYEHGSASHISPVRILAYEKSFNIAKNKELLLSRKNKWWDNKVKKFFERENCFEIVQLSELEFWNDLTNSYRVAPFNQEDFRFLWSHNNCMGGGNV